MQVNTAARLLRANMQNLTGILHTLRDTPDMVSVPCSCRCIADVEEAKESVRLTLPGAGLEVGARHDL